MREKSSTEYYVTESGFLSDVAFAYLQVKLLSNWWLFCYV